MMPKRGKGADRWFRRTGWTMAAALAALLAGCSDPSNPLRSASFYPVKGKVTLPDGKPLPGVKVVFSGPATSGATTESDGTFAFKDDKGGLPAGDYKVRLEVVESKGATKKSTVPFPGKYLDEDSSDLKAKVTAAGPNDFDFKLTKDDPAAGRGGAGGHRPRQGP
jgi:Carboxypeptidase regulatory-like domain